MDTWDHLLLKATQFQLILIPVKGPQVTLGSKALAAAGHICGALGNIVLSKSYSPTNLFKSSLLISSFPSFHVRVSTRQKLHLDIVFKSKDWRGLRGGGIVFFLPLFFASVRTHHYSLILMRFSVSAL